MGVFGVTENVQKYTCDSPSHNTILQIIHLNELPEAAGVVVVCGFSIAKRLMTPMRHESDECAHGFERGSIINAGRLLEEAKHHLIVIKARIQLNIETTETETTA